MAFESRLLRRLRTRYRSRLYDESNAENIPRCAFIGANWNTDDSARKAKEQIIRAFAEWSSLQAVKSPLTGKMLKTGLEFRLVEPTIDVPQPPAEIELRYEPLAAITAASTNRLLNADGTVSLTALTFNSANRWWFGTAPTTPADRMHFCSSALHEIGHIVGLWESNDPKSVMIFYRQPGPNGPAFDHLDEESKRVAYELYSIPVESDTTP